MHVYIRSHTALTRLGSPSAAGRNDVSGELVRSKSHTPSVELPTWWPPYACVHEGLASHTALTLSGELVRPHTRALTCLGSPSAAGRIVVSGELVRSKSH